MNELTTIASNPAEMVKAVASRVTAVQNIYKEIMKEGKDGGGDYGVIKGCGTKPTLLKAGAEKLIMAFGLTTLVKSTGEKELPGNHREYTVITQLLTRNGELVSEGVGVCSSMESKYRYRGGQRIATGEVVPKEYWNAKKSGDLKKAAELIGGEGFSVMKDDSGNWVICSFGAKAENEDPADVYNTVLKMAKKRSLVDAVLTGTGASDIFTQDVEEIVENQRANAAKRGEHAPEPVKTAPAPAAPVPAQAAPALNQTEPSGAPVPVDPPAAPARPPLDPTPPARCVISEPQRKRLYAIFKGTSMTDEAFKKLLGEYGYARTDAVTVADYDAIVDAVQNYGKGGQ